MSPDGEQNAGAWPCLSPEARKEVLSPPCIAAGLAVLALSALLARGARGGSHVIVAVLAHATPTLGVVAGCLVSLLVAVLPVIFLAL